MVLSSVYKVDVFIIKTRIGQSDMSTEDKTETKPWTKPWTKLLKVRDVAGYI